MRKCIPVSKYKPEKTGNLIIIIIHTYTEVAGDDVIMKRSRNVISQNRYHKQ